MKSHFSMIALLLLIGQAQSSAQTADTDSDGMPDNWETSMGLNPTDPNDAFSDLDGDRVPNLWEYARGTNAALPNSLSTAADAVVNPHLLPDGSQNVGNVFATMQQAQEYIVTSTSFNPEYRYLVYVLHGTQAASLLPGWNTTTWEAMPIAKIAWIAELSPSKMDGEEGCILKGLGLGLEFADDVVLDGFVLDGSTSLHAYPAVWIEKPTPESSYVPKLRLVNCIIRNWRTYSSWSEVSGALLAESSELSLVHTTVYNSSGERQDPETGVALLGSIIDLRNGAHASIVNSILWDSERELAAPILGGTHNIVTSIVQGGGPTAITAPPNLSKGGYLTTSSTVAIGHNANNWSLHFDRHGESRGNSTLHIGADHWVNTDADSLPDWWEVFSTGNYNLLDSTTPFAQPMTWDNLWASNTALELFLMNHIGSQDQDQDGLRDSWEKIHFTHIWKLGALADPDSDTATNWEEQQIGTDPNRSNSTEELIEIDANSNELPDLIEFRHFGKWVTTEVYLDSDEDGLTDYFEIMVSSTNPNLADTNGNGMNDRIDWMAQLNGLQVNSIKVVGPPQINILYPIAQ